MVLSSRFAACGGSLQGSLGPPSSATPNPDVLFSLRRKLGTVCLVTSTRPSSRRISRLARCRRASSCSRWTSTSASSEKARTRTGYVVAASLARDTDHRTARSVLSFCGATTSCLSPASLGRSFSRSAVSRRSPIQSRRGSALLRAGGLPGIPQLDRTPPSLAGSLGEPESRSSTRTWFVPSTFLPFAI